VKKIILAILLLTAALSAAFAQRIPVVGIMPFTTENRTITPEDAANVTRLVIEELTSWGMNIVSGGNGAEYIVQGTLSRQGSAFVLTGQTIEAKSEKMLNESKEQASALKDISIFTFCTKIIEMVPFPNYLLGKWQSSLNMPDGPVVCIIEFKSNRTITVERYDTWEHRQRNSLRYEGYGTGNYSYAGYYNRRTMTVNSQTIRIDASANIYLKLEETLPEQTNVSQSRLGLLFSEDKNSFEIIGGALPCGRNYDGNAVYPSATIGFTRFTKIR